MFVKKNIDLFYIKVSIEKGLYIRNSMDNEQIVAIAMTNDYI